MDAREDEPEEEGDDGKDIFKGGQVIGVLMMRLEPTGRAGKENAE